MFFYFGVLDLDFHKPWYLWF